VRHYMGQTITQYTHHYTWSPDTIHVAWSTCYVMYIVNYTRNFCHDTRARRAAIAREALRPPFRAVPGGQGGLQIRGGLAAEWFDST
jgi:hypothetical protein